MARLQLNTERESTSAVRAPVVRDFISVALLFLVSRASVLGAFPFSAAFFAACFDKSIAYIGVTAICIGLFSAGAKIVVVKYIMSALLYWLFDKLRPQRLKSPIIGAAACGVSVLIGGLFILIADFDGIYSVLMLATEGIIASMMYLVFNKADVLLKTRENRSQAAKDEIVSVAITAGVIITGLTGVNFPFGINLSDIAAVYAVMIISYHSSLSAAGSGGLCIGFMTAMGSSEALLMMGVMGLSALFSNLLKTFGKLGAAAGMIGGAAAAALYAGHEAVLPLNIYEVSIAVMLFLLTPPRAHRFIRVFFANNLSIEKVELETRVKDYLSSRLDAVSEAFSKLEKCFLDSSEKRLKLYSREVGAMLDDVSGRVCAKCPMSNKCWQSEFSDTYKQVMLMLNTIESEGMITAVPREFGVRCANAEKFISEFNHVYEMYKLDLIRRGEAISARDMITEQYREISDMARTFSQEIRDGFVFREDFEETAVVEMDKHGINLFEISVIESSEGRLELYAGLGMGTDIKRAEAIFTEVTSTPIGYIGAEKNGMMKFASQAKYSVDFAVRQRCKEHGRVNGDSVTVFRDGEDKMYFLISDGMGSGKRASAESKITLSLLEEFLKSGFGVKNSIEMINSSLCLKLDSECFATIDLLALDLMTGMAEFYKIGSAQSFVYTDGKVDTIFSASIPAGMLKGVKVASQRRKLSDGDTVLMMSDGVSEAGFTTVRTEWIKKEITSLADTMEDMADNVIFTAVKKSRGTVVDDMSVIAIRLDEI